MPAPSSALVDSLCWSFWEVGLGPAGDLAVSCSWSGAFRHRRSRGLCPMLLAPLGSPLPVWAQPLPLRGYLDASIDIINRFSSSSCRWSHS